MGFGVWGLGFGVWGWGFGVKVLLTCLKLLWDGARLAQQGLVDLEGGVEELAVSVKVGGGVRVGARLGVEMWAVGRVGGGEDARARAYWQL